MNSIYTEVSSENSPFLLRYMPTLRGCVYQVVSTMICLEKKICFKSKFVLCNHCSVKTRCFVSNRRIPIRGWKPATDFLVVRFFFSEANVRQVKHSAIVEKGAVKRGDFSCVLVAIFIAISKGFFCKPTGDFRCVFTAI